MSDTTIPATLADHPPSDKLVYRIIAAEEPIRRAAIAEQGQLPAGTMDKALRRLREAGLVATTHDCTDARSTAYETR